MGKPDPAPDPFHRDLDELGRLYVLLAAKVEPAQGEGGGRRPQPASRPPLQIDPVSLMAEIEHAIGYYLNQARWILHPIRRINITDRTGATCPYCDGALVAWLRSDSDDPNDTHYQPDEVVCLTPTQHHLEEPFRWSKSEWPRLGVLTGVREDARYGPRLPGDLTASG